MAAIRKSALKGGEREGREGERDGEGGRERGKEGDISHGT